MANSIMTNASAMTALKTLNMTNKNLEKTQSTISTGYRVAEAADNAAYWSIATTMRSDNKALSTVNDALGLGKSTVDVAYTALNASKDVLDAIKTKLVAAKQPGLDKGKIQTEISQLQKQLEGIASAASFSGNNWLSVDSSKSGYSAMQKVVSSFARNSDGSFNIGQIDIDTRNIALFDAGANSGSGTTLKGVGLLEKGLGNTNAGTLAASGTTGATTTAGTAAKAGNWTSSTEFTYTQGDAANGDDFKLAVTVDGGSAQNLNINIANAATFGLNDLVTGINASGVLTGATAANIDGKLVITSNSTGSSSSIAVSMTGIHQNGTTTATTATTSLTGGGSGVNGAAATAGKVEMAASLASSITLDNDDTLSFDIAIDGADAQTVKIDRALINSTLSVTNGTIANATQMRSVLDAAFDGATVAVNGNGKLTFTSNSTGAASAISITNVKASNGGNNFGVMEIDITKAGANLDEYIAGIDTMAKNVTTAASDLGAVKSRIGMQTDFVKNLMDAIDRGVGTMVDADMNEESTKLQALQVQQQLGIQALSMANGSAQSILSLFRG